MAYIRGSPPQEPRSSEEASEEETESDEALARRLQAEEQGRPVARFELLDHVEARYKDPELRGGTWSRDYYAATVVDVLPPKTQKRPHSYMLRWDDGSEDQLVLEDYIRPAPEAPAAEPRERDGKRGLANGFRTEAPPPKKRGRPSKKGGRPPKAPPAGAGPSRRHRDGRRGSPLDARRGATLARARRRAWRGGLELADDRRRTRHGPDQGSRRGAL